MSTTRNVFRALVVVAAVTSCVLSLAPPPARAATVVLIQEWERGALDTFRTGARWSDSGLTGVGTEFFFLDRFTASRFLNGIGQFSAVAQFTSPQSLVLPGNTVARYVNGVFDGFGNTQIPGGGVASVSLFDEFVGIGAGGYGFTGRGIDELFVYFPPVSGRAEYDLVSSTFVNPPSVVPLPASLPLFAAALGLLGWYRRR